MNYNPNSIYFINEVPPRGVNELGQVLLEENRVDFEFSSSRVACELAQLTCTCSFFFFLPSNIFNGPYFISYYQGIDSKISDVYDSRSAFLCFLWIFQEAVLTGVSTTECSNGPTWTGDWRQLHCTNVNRISVCIICCFLSWNLILVVYSVVFVLLIFRTLINFKDHFQQNSKGRSLKSN